MGVIFFFFFSLSLSLPVVEWLTLYLGIMYLVYVEVSIALKGVRSEFRSCVKVEVAVLGFPS